MTLDLTPSAAQTALRDRVRTAFEPFRGWYRERRSAELTGSYVARPVTLGLPPAFAISVTFLPSRS